MISALLLFACSGDNKDGDIGVDDTGASLDPATVPLTGECPAETHWGNFVATSTEDYAYVSGAISDGIVPTTVLTHLLDSGDCTLWRRENPYCGEGCASGTTCDLTGECVPYPTTQDLGTVRLGGLGETLSLDPKSPGYTYSYTSFDDNPPWTAGALLTLSTEAVTYSAVTLHGVTPVSLAPTSLDWLLTDGEGLEVAWDVPTGTPRTQVLVALTIDLHGLTPASVSCVFDDDGGGEIPADIVSELIGFGVTGFPIGKLTRRTADAAEVGEGCVDFVVSSSRTATLAISGYTPCTRDEDCPEEQECNEELERCE